MITLPLRAEARLASGFVRHSRRRRVVRRHGKRRFVTRRVTRLVTTAHVRHNRADTVAGRLVTREGAGLPNAAVYAFSRVAGQPEAYAGLVNTDVAGRFRYRVRGDASRTIRFVYLGAPSIRPASQSVEMIVPSETSFGVSRSHVLNGQRVMFAGRLSAAPAGLGSGKLVDLQTKLSGHWQTFRDVHTDASGRWRSPYRFRRTHGNVRYQFRVRVPTEAGYPYGVGVSKSIKIGVRGR